MKLVSKIINHDTLPMFSFTVSYQQRVVYSFIEMEVIMLLPPSYST